MRIALCYWRFRHATQPPFLYRDLNFSPHSIQIMATHEYEPLAAAGSMLRILPVFSLRIHPIVLHAAKCFIPETPLFSRAKSARCPPRPSLLFLRSLGDFAPLSATDFWPFQDTRDQYLP